MQDSFYKTGDYFKESGIERVEPIMIRRRPFALLNTLVWYFAILVPIMHYLVKLIFSGELLYFSIGATIIAICKLRIVASAY